MKTGFTWIQLLIVIALIAVAVAFALPAIQRMRAQHDLVLCKERLRRIGISFAQYARANDGRLPVGNTIDGPQRELLDGFAAEHLLGEPQNYYCPAQRQPDSAVVDRNFNAGLIGYYYYSARDSGGNSHLSKFLRTGVSWPRELDTSMDPKSWVMSDIWVSAEPTAHAGFRKGVNFLMLDGSVDFVSGSPRRSFR